MEMKTKYFGKSVVDTLKGLWITWREIFRPDHTIQYPEQTLPWPARSRGRLVLPIADDTRQHKCKACLMCERICPNQSIQVKTRVNAENKRELDAYIYKLDQCTFCGLCVELCPFDALAMSHQHESATEKKSDMVIRLDLEKTRSTQAWQGGLSARADAKMNKEM